MTNKGLVRNYLNTRYRNSKLSGIKTALMNQFDLSDEKVRCRNKLMRTQFLQCRRLYAECEPSEKDFLNRVDHFLVRFSLIPKEKFLLCYSTSDNKFNLIKFLWHEISPIRIKDCIDILVMSRRLIYYRGFCQSTFDSLASGTGLSSTSLKKRTIRLENYFHALITDLQLFKAYVDIPGVLLNNANCFFIDEKTAENMNAGYEADFSLLFYQYLFAHYWQEIYTSYEAHINNEIIYIIVKGEVSIPLNKLMHRLSIETKKSFFKFTFTGIIEFNKIIEAVSDILKLDIKSTGRIHIVSRTKTGVAVKNLLRILQTRNGIHKKELYLKLLEKGEVNLTFTAFLHDINDHKELFHQDGSYIYINNYDKN